MSTVPAGSVISQAPTACTACVALGTLVDLVISTGPVNEPPAVVITSPVDGTTSAADALLNLIGTATDLEDGDLGASLVWTSSKDGVLGTGTELGVVLSKGRHTITATATDSGGASGSAQVSIWIKNSRGGQ